MESEEIQDRDPFLQTTHRTHEAGDPASARKHRDVTETIVMSQVPGSVEGEEKEDLSLSHDLALLFVMKDHIWDGSSSIVEKDPSQERERGPGDLENWTEFSDGKHSLNREESSLKESRESSLNSLDGEFATHSSSNFQSFLLDTNSPAFIPPRGVNAGQMEGQIHEVSFGQSPTWCDVLPQTWHEESAITDSLPGQEDSVNEPPLVIHNISHGHKSAEFSQSRSAEDHSRMLETLQEKNRHRYKGINIVVRAKENSSKKEEASKRLSNPSSEEEELNLDGTQRNEDNILFQMSSKEEENHSDVDDETRDLGGNVLSCHVLHLQEEEESKVEVSKPLSLMEHTPANCNSSSLNCDESESDPKQLSTTMKPQFAEMEALELASGEEKREKNLNASKTKTNLEEVQLAHNDPEEQEWTVQATIASVPIRLCPGTIDSLENSLASSGLNNTEEFAFSFKEVSSADHSPTSACVLPESCVQTSTRMTPAGSQPDRGSPRIQAAIYHSSGQVEHSGIYDKTSKMSCCDQDGSQTTTDVGKEDIEKENVRSADGEQVSQLFTDVALGIDSQCLYDSRPMRFSSDSEQNPVPSLRTIASALLQEDPSKGVTDGTVPCAGDESSQLDRARCDEDSALDSDGDDHLPAFGEDFLEDLQSSTSGILPNPSLEEGLSNIAKEMIKLSLSSWGSAQDTTENDVMSHQQLEPTMKNAGLSGKEAVADTHWLEQDSLTSESPCFSVLGEERREYDSDADSLPSCWTLFAKPTETTQQTQPSAPDLVRDSEQTLPLAYVSLLSSRQPLQFVSPPPTANAQPIPPGLNPRDPGQLLEQLPSSSQVNPLALKSSANQTLLEPSPLAPETRLSEQLSTSENDSDPCCQVPHSVHHSAPHHASSPVLSSRSVFPSFSAASQQDNSKQTPQSAAAGPGRNFPTQPPPIAVSKGSPRSRSDSNPRKHLVVRGNPSAQRRAEASQSSPLVSRTGSDEQIHHSPPTGNPVGWNSSSISKPGDLVLISSLDDGMEEVSGLPLAKSAPQNMGHTCLELGLSLSDLQGERLGNGATGAGSFSSLPETTSQCADMPDGRSFHYTFHPSGDREAKPTNARQPPSLLAFTNPIHFLQLGPPSPPSVPYPGMPQAELQDPQWPKPQTRNAEDPVASPSEGPGRFRKVLEKSAGEPVCAALHRKGVEGRHPRLEKSSSCPDKNTLGLGSKESAFGTKKQQAAVKQRAKSKDWHRHGVRKISIPTDGTIEVPAPPHSREEAVGHKDRANHLDFGKYGEKKITENTENIKRRRSRLINSSKLLYQEYSDDALNKAIQSQKQMDSLSEEAEPLSPKLRRRVPVTQDSYLQRLSISSGSSLWQDIPMVRGSTMLLSMTREEQKLQEAKFELIASEASYLRSLNVAVDHFQHSQELQGVLSTQDKQWLFSRLQDVRDVSANFLFELEEKLEENMFTFNVCDVALKNAPEFRRVYLPYVTNQTYQDQTFQRLMNGVPAFQQVLEKLESDPVCQRLSLKSFLILPFQRITRLKLLLQNILKRIPPGADEEVQATQAYDALEKLIKDCNVNVQRMKSTEELIHLSQNMEFECKIFPLISQSRRLVKHGELTALEYNISLKWKLTTRPIYLHLFNDYLLLSRPRENGRFIVFDYAASSDVRGEKCEMKLHGDNKNLFRLFLLQNNQGKKVEFLFRTETQSEKLRWISALMPQQPEPDLLDDSDAPQVQCVKSYKAREHDELTLEKADIIMVLRQSSDGWVKGVKLSDGERGWFPLDHVEVISSKQIRQMNLKEEQRVKNAKQQVFHRR